MAECKSVEILSSNLKKLLILHLILKTRFLTATEFVFSIMWFILVNIWRENLPKYGKVITNSLLGTVLTIVLKCQSMFCLKII